ncbi:hypothetical protein Emag_000021 [Eimeria magna]
MPSLPVTLARHIAATRLIRRSPEIAIFRRAFCALGESAGQMKSGSRVLASLPCVDLMRRLFSTDCGAGSAESGAVEAEAQHRGEQLQAHTVSFASHDGKMRLSCRYRPEDFDKFPAAEEEEMILLEEAPDAAETWVALSGSQIRLVTYMEAPS